MSDNVRFHSKHHGKTHHTDATAGYNDSAVDPIAGSSSPFMGNFHLSGCHIVYDTSTSASKTLCYADYINYYDGTYTTVSLNSGSWTATGNSKWTVTGNNLYPNSLTDSLGLGTATPDEMLTVTGNISAKGNITTQQTVVADGGDSLLWNACLSTVSENSGGWEENRLDITNIANVSADWNSTQTTVNTYSGDWTWVAENSGSTPPGVLMPYAGSTAPNGYLLCDGSIVATATYPDLFDVVGITYGGTIDNFALPDLRGRVPAGKDDMGGSAASRLTNPGTTVGGVAGATLGATGGEEAHQITVAELAAHTHTQDYTYNVYANQYDRTGGSVGTRDSGSTGGDVAHNTVQPTLILNYIIKT